MKTSFYWDSQCLVSGSEKSVVIKKGTALWNILGVIPQTHLTEAVIQREPRLYLELAAKVDYV